MPWDTDVVGFGISMRRNGLSSNSNVYPSAAIFDAQCKWHSIKNEKVHLGWAWGVVDWSNKNRLSPMRPLLVSHSTPKANVVLTIRHLRPSILYLPHLWCISAMLHICFHPKYDAFSKPYQPNCDLTALPMCLNVFHSGDSHRSNTDIKGCVLQRCQGVPLCEKALLFLMTWDGKQMKKQNCFFISGKKFKLKPASFRLAEISLVKWVCDNW